LRTRDPRRRISASPEISDWLRPDELRQLLGVLELSLENRQQLIQLPELRKLTHLERCERVLHVCRDIRQVPFLHFLKAGAKPPDIGQPGFFKAFQLTAKDIDAEFQRKGLQVRRVVGIHVDCIPLQNVEESFENFWVCPVLNNIWLVKQEAVIGHKYIAFLVKHSVRDGERLTAQNDFGFSLPEAELGTQAIERAIGADLRRRETADGIDEGTENPTINRL
jgi:hypothetical protein